MKKIMFNDKYGLTRAVLVGSKTMTRRVVRKGLVGVLYKIGEVVAVAQSYKDVVDEDVRGHYIPRWTFIDDHCDEAGWSNKMFVKPDLMPHRIRITNIKVERLQDISVEDCLKEGLRDYGIGFGFDGWVNEKNELKYSPNPRIAFAALINKVFGKGTWKSNPVVYAYEFELVNGDW